MSRSNTTLEFMGQVDCFDATGIKMGPAQTFNDMFTVCDEKVTITNQHLANLPTKLVFRLVGSELRLVYPEQDSDVFSLVQEPGRNPSPEMRNRNNPFAPFRKTTLDAGSNFLVGFAPYDQNVIVPGNTYYLGYHFESPRDGYAIACTCTSRTPYTVIDHEHCWPVLTFSVNLLSEAPPAVPEKGSGGKVITNRRLGEDRAAKPYLKPAPLQHVAPSKEQRNDGAAAGGGEGGSKGGVAPAPRPSALARFTLSTPDLPPIMFDDAITAIQEIRDAGAAALPKPEGDGGPGA